MDPYVYSGTDVLINKFQIKDKEEWQIKEQTVTSKNMIKLFEKKDLKIETAEDYKNLHKYIFDDMYNWAGKSRTINISKPEPVLNGFSVPYENAVKIDDTLEKIFDRAEKAQPENMNIEEFQAHTSQLVADVWRTHPFREGNTRTAFAFAKIYTEQHGYSFDSQLIKDRSQYFRDALSLANFYNEHHKPLEEDTKYLKNIFKDSIKENNKELFRSRNNHLEME